MDLNQYKGLFLDYLSQKIEKRQPKNFATKALNNVCKLSVSEDKKDILRTFSNELMNRTI